MRKFIFTSALVLFSVFIYAQSKYPIPIMPGSQQVISAGNDTLWVLNNRQFNKTIYYAKLCKNYKKQINNLEQQVKNLTQQKEQLDTLYQATVKEKDRYYSNWTDCKKGLDVVAKKYNQCSAQKNLILYGGIAISAISFILGAIIF